MRQGSPVSLIRAWGAGLLLLSQIAAGATVHEPSYCRYENFIEKEVRTPIQEGLVRARAFKLGSVTLVGLAVGLSDVESVQRLAELLSDAGASKNYCTWYLNHGNSEASKSFVWKNLPLPMFLTPHYAARRYREILASSFSQDSLSFLSCMEKESYLALGCDGMKHRGPSAFGMLLAYSGCSSENSLEIVNRIWGKNFVPDHTREAIIDAGREIGDQDPVGRARMRSLLTKN